MNPCTGTLWVMASLPVASAPTAASASIAASESVVAAVMNNSATSWLWSTSSSIIMVSTAVSSSWFVSLISWVVIPWATGECPCVDIHI